MARPIEPCAPHTVDTVVIGGGPSSLILSYILHGHVPYYTKTHHDPLLNTKLSQERNLLKITPDACAHFYSSLRYSTQALPLNALLDTLIRPNADTEINPESCVEWRFEPERAVKHIVLTSGSDAGGQWVDNPVSTSPDIGTLSYSEMLSLPGYSYAEHYAIQNGSCLPEFQRPSRAEVAHYFAVYPDAVGIRDSFRTSTQVSNVARAKTGFYVGSHGIFCRHLVLASGIFSQTLGPPPLLSPLINIDVPSEPLVVIGSGFSAADVIISVPPTRKIIHIFRWAPETRPSPLRGCHRAAYPEYASIYRQMKLASMASKKSRVASPMMTKKINPFFSHRDWQSMYEGFPNAEIIDVQQEGISARLRIRLESGEIVERLSGGLEYVVGRRGSLDYLSPSLLREILSSTEVFEGQGTLISSGSLRSKVEIDFEVAPAVFAIGSLTGDSLVRYAFGGCVAAAGKIILGKDEPSKTDRATVIGKRKVGSHGETRHNNGLEVQVAQEHTDLHIDRREILSG